MFDPDATDRAIAVAGFGTPEWEPSADDLSRWEAAVDLLDECDVVDLEYDAVPPADIEYDAARAGEPLAAVLQRLEAQPMGPSTVALLSSFDPTEVDDAARVSMAVLWARAESYAAAGKVAAVAAFAAPGRAREALADCEIAAALALGDGEALRLLHESRQLVGCLPQTLAALRRGDLSARKAHLIADRSFPLSPDQCRDFEERVLPTACARSYATTDAAARRALAIVDPDGHEERRRQAKKDIALIRQHHGDGTGELFARMESTDLEIVWTAADAWARRAKAAGDERTLDALRVAALVAFAERFLTDPDGPRRHGRPITVNLTMDLTTFLGLTDHAGELLGTGAMIPAEAIRDLIPDAELRRLITDPMTGHLLDAGRRTYRPSAALAGFVAARDVNATTPNGSTAAAGAGDLDHIESHDAGGGTDRAILHSPTRRWHRARTMAGWTVRREEDGGWTWTSPLGRAYRNHPHDYRLGP